MSGKERNIDEQNKRIRYRQMISNGEILITVDPDAVKALDEEERLQLETVLSDLDTME